MKKRVNSEALAPLLDVARNDHDPAVCHAALDVASRFTLSEEAWRALAATLGAVVDALARQAPERAALLILAARVPLLSMRRELRAIAADAGDPAADAVANALVEAGDPSQIARLLAEAHAGRWEAFEGLAAMPLEQAGVTLSQLAAPPPSDALQARLWHALVAARLGECVWLDPFLLGKEPEPPIFFGAPAIPYARIAAAQPLPEALQAHLSALLPETDRFDDAGRARMARIVIWAATGSADADGVPIEVGPRTEVAPPSPQQRKDALAVAQAFLRPPTVSQFAVIDTLNGGAIGVLLAQILADANAKAAALPAQVPVNQVIGNAVVGLVAVLPHAEDGSMTSLLWVHLRTARPAVDDEQMAWVIAHAPPRRWIGEIAAMLGAPERPPAERLRILQIAMAAADHSAGRGVSPYRGSGGARSRAPTGRGPMIEDQGQQAMPPQVGAGAAPGDELSIEPPPSEPALPERPPTLGASGAGAIPAAGAPLTERDERRVNAEILESGSKRLSFVAGRENVIRCWIGLPEREVAAADRSIPPVSIPPEGLLLQVQLYWRDGSGNEHKPVGSLLLPAQLTARSGDCDLSIHVPDGERYVCAEILFRYRGRVFECVRVEGFALASGEQEQPRQQILVRVQASRRDTIEIADSQLVDATIVVGSLPGPRGAETANGPGSMRVFGREGARGFDLSDASKAIAWLNETLATTEKVLVRRQAASVTGAATQSVLDDNDPDVNQLLRDMARHGAGLYNQLVRDGFVDPGDRIQVLNHEPDTYVPLEFVYDRGYPRSDARLCAAGLEALRSDAAGCPVCKIPASGDELGSTAVICPFGFWSIRKVIERIASGVAGTASLPKIDRRGLPVLNSVVFASSHRVPTDEIDATRNDLAQKFGVTFFADDWSQWRDAIKQRPSLLLLLPHHGVQAQLDYLEIGDEKLPEDLGKLSRSQLLPAFVNVDGRDPGPVVLLLGCRTATDEETGYAKITQLFQDLHASIVLGTLAEVLGRHAAPVARDLVDELVAIQDAQTDFGTVMRRVRRRMLARGTLMALCLVAFGDAEWRVTPRPAAGRR